MANHIEMRKLVIRTISPGGNESWTETWQYRTKDIVASVLGLIPLTSTWTPWTNIESVSVDQNGDPFP